MGITWRLVPTEEVGFVWPSVAPILSAAVERDEGRRSLQSVLRQLVNDQNQLWVVSDIDPIGGVVTAILHYPHKRVLKVEWLAGDRFNEWSHLISVLKDFARSSGCCAVEIAGRPGVVKVMQQFGFEVTGWEARSLVNA